MSTATYQRFQDLQAALKEWIRSGRQGTAPRKVRANSSETSELSRQARVKRDRKKEKITKSIQKQRRAKVQNVTSPRAVRVKIADLRDNLRGSPDDYPELKLRYRQALARLGAQG